MRCAIWYPLCNLKNVKNTHGGMLLLVKLQASVCNFTKSNTPPWVFFTFFKLYKRYQFAQNITTHIKLFSFYFKSYLSCFLYVTKKSIQKLKYRQNEKSLEDEIKDIFHHFSGAFNKENQIFFLEDESLTVSVNLV